MSNPYDKARELARSIKESDAYQKFMEQKKLIDEDPETKTMLSDFQKRQYELQLKQMNEEELSEEDSKKLQELFQILSLNNKASDYLAAEYQFGLMMQEISKTLSDIIDE
ncbi:MAG TPA: YlbF family regulator [Tissierellia bacterium]|nr:YlbF family regulator [Tissierellia bacterium]